MMEWNLNRLAVELQAYEPTCAQELGDRAAMISCLPAFSDILDRNLVAHFTGSAWIVNKERTKVLMVYHNLYQSWSWTGGHADGEADLLAVAMREAVEETGVSQVMPVFDGIFALDVLPVWSHVRRGVFVPSHLHLNAAYLLEADEADALSVCADENSGVAWIPLDEVHAHVSEPDMLPVYDKLMARMKR